MYMANCYNHGHSVLLGSDSHTLTHNTMQYEHEVVYFLGIRSRYLGGKVGEEALFGYVDIHFIYVFIYLFIHTLLF